MSLPAVFKEHSVFISVCAFVLIFVFGAGWITHSYVQSTLSSSSTSPSPTTQPTPSQMPTPLPPSPTAIVASGSATKIIQIPVMSPTKIFYPKSDTIEFVPFSLPVKGNAYFDDTVTAFIDTKPPLVVISTYTRQQTDANYIHTSRASFFDGSAWHRNTATKQSANVQFTSNDVTTALNIFQAKDRVLRQRIDTNLIIDGSSIQISTDNLENEIAIRAEPTYTRLFSDSTGKVTIKGTKYPARILYAKWYSMDNSQLSFYDKNLGLTTNVIDLWLKDGSTLHIDTTQVKNPTALYSTHELGIYKDAEDSVAKTFSVDMNNSTELPPSSWSGILSEPLNISFKGTTVNSLKRAEGQSYNWYRGLMSATVTLPDGKTVDGTGTFEYIKEN